MNKREITKEMLLNYAGNMQDSLINNLLSQLELEFREEIAKEIEYAPHHHNMLQPCDGCKDKEFYLQVIRKELP
jgi:hypothetical protein